jgi:hypothetical protein
LNFDNPSEVNLFAYRVGYLKSTELNMKHTVIQQTACKVAFIRRCDPNIASIKTNEHLKKVKILLTKDC